MESSDICRGESAQARAGPGVRGPGLEGRRGGHDRLWTCPVTAIKSALAVTDGEHPPGTDSVRSLAGRYCCGLCRRRGRRHADRPVRCGAGAIQPTGTGAYEVATVRQVPPCPVTERDVGSATPGVPPAVERRAGAGPEEGLSSGAGRRSAGD